MQMHINLRMICALYESLHPAIGRDQTPQSTVAKVLYDVLHDIHVLWTCWSRRILHVLTRLTWPSTSFIFAGPFLASNICIPLGFEHVPWLNSIFPISMISCDIINTCAWFGPCTKTKQILLYISNTITIKIWNIYHIRACPQFSKILKSSTP